MTFKTNVRTKSVIPQTKIVLYSSVPCGVSPKLIWTIYAVIVSMGTSGFMVNLGCWPAAMATIMVSPIARETARMTAAVIPERAAGKTILKATWILREPRAYAPSRQPIGTACIASSLNEDTSGMIMIPITSPAESALKPDNPGINCFNKGVTNNNAK